mgnify:CR=1 FL=1
MTERPYTTKINTGDEPISNTIWGLDGTYQKNSPFITKMVDKLPFLETKAKSSIIATAEFAHLIPGHHKSLGNSGVSYIDDFEASKTGIDSIRELIDSSQYAPTSAKFKVIILDEVQQSMCRG